MNENDAAKNQDEFEDSDYDDTEEDSFADDMKAHFTNREQDRQAEADEDKAEQERMARHTDSEGNFKSVADAMLYNGDSIPADLGPGSPRAEDYKPNQIDQYYADREAYILSGGQRLSGGITAFEDDPHRSKRLELMAEDREWAEKEAIAKEEGKTDDLDRARYFRKDIGKQMRALPVPPEIRHARDLNNKQRRDSLEMAFDPETAGADWWDGDRMKQDAATLAAEHLVNSDDGTIFLPAESGRFGNPEPFTPKTAIKFYSLSENVLRQIRYNIQNEKDKSPDALFRSAWATLNRLGLAHTGKAATEKPAPKAKKKKSSNAGYNKNMTQAEYDDWRMRNGARPY